jgi:hypothetical protein
MWAASTKNDMGLREKLSLTIWQRNWSKNEMTQKQALLAYLKSHSKGITTWVAFDALGISCVHKRISELEKDG